MKKLFATTISALVVAAATMCAKATEPCGPLPTADQIALQDMEMYAFIHYSLNTYTDQEWGYGDEDPAIFDPANLDVEQWVTTCKNAGMKGIIFTAKHHCGFCMWPSEYTDYSVKSSPWKDGKGDVVAELAEACRRHGLKFAVYLSPWDRNHPEYGREEYVTYFRNQLRELLTNYGDIYEVWFDGANGGDGWYGGANETRRIDRLTYYGWGETYDMIRRLQPHCVIWNDGADRRGDLRWVGTDPQTGERIKIEFDEPGNFRAWPYLEASVMDAKHPSELEDCGYVNVNIDQKIQGVGGIDSWGAEPLGKYKIDYHIPHTMTVTLTRQ